MKSNLTLITLLTFAVAVIAVPAFAQHGGLGAQAGGATVGAGRHADVHTNTSVNAKAGEHRRSDEREDARESARIVKRIDADPEVASRVKAMLPSGMSISTAASGFRNEGQFLATLHASQNLGIPFTDLKAKMTSSEHMSLGEAIKSLRPNMDNEDAKEEARKAEKQAKVTASDEREDAREGARIATRIDANPGVASRVQAMLPSGMSISTAASGFRNEGQFLATLHASQNLGIPFTDLKAKMTGSEHMSLGEAIKSSKPNMDNEDAREEARKAETQAKVTASAKATASAGTKVDSDNR